VILSLFAKVIVYYPLLNKHFFQAGSPINWEQSE